MKRILASLVVAAMGLLATPAQAADITLIHGINGLDLKQTRDLPVDIALNGKCTYKGVKFTQSAQFALDKGSYRVTVHPSNGSCSTSPVIDQTVTIDDSNLPFSLTLVASLTETGSPRLAVYTNNRDYGFAVAVAVRHVAFAPALFSKIEIPTYPKRTTKRIKNGDYGDAFAAWDSAFPYKITISTARSGGVVARTTGKFRSSRVTWRIFHIVGSAKNGLALVQQDVLPGK